MKKELVADTENVRRSYKCIRYLLDRPKSEMVGLGLMYGVPGVGKTRFARRFAIENDYIYLRLRSNTTARSFAIQLAEAIMIKYNISERIKGSASTIFDKCVEIINDVDDDVIIFIDEIDYAFKDYKLLGEIRDIVDETLAVIILVGMQDAKKQLLKANVHYFDRCNYFVEYKKLDQADVKLVIEKISEYPLDNQTVEAIYQLSGGTLRKVLKLLYAIETIAQAKKIKEITYNDIQGVLDNDAVKKGI